MNTRTKAYLQSKFLEYYKNAIIGLPPRFKKREWAFILFDSAYPKLVMRRHKAFSSQKDLQQYLGTVAPAHVFYSTACYAYPSATRMQDKKWTGADIVFDLDADKLFVDSIPSYAHMLRAVKKETRKLIDFLTLDFGVDSADFNIVFSGGRGYHVHLLERRLGTLGSHERREVVNYLTGTGLEPEYLMKRTDFASPNNGSCWEIRIRAWIKSYFESLRELEPDPAVARLAAVKAVGKRRAHEIVDLLSQGSSIHPFADTKLMPPNAWKSLVREAITRIRVNVDVPVTADTKRLIRLPTSLHGGSGLRVTPLTVDDFGSFDPLRDAVVFGEDSVPVRILKPVTTEIMGETIKAHQGKNALPEHTAVHLMARGLAEYESR